MNADANDAPRGRLLSLNVGRVQPLKTGPRSEPSAIHKRSVEGSVVVRPLGLDGDEQADHSVHGGLAKAVYAYPHEHYPVWRTLRAQAGAAPWDEQPEPGLMGENLTLTGLLEADAYIGDVLRFPDCALAVSEPRFPCHKFEAAIGFRHAARMMVQSGLCGFYLAVREPGTLAAGQTYRLETGPREVSIAELFRARTSASR